MTILPASFTKPAKALVTAGVIAVSAATVGACASKTDKQVNTDNKPRMEWISCDTVDFSKPNLPVIYDDCIEYRNTEGQIVHVKMSNAARAEVTSLYEAINKMSTEKQPVIKDIGKFFTEVVKNMPKDNLFNSAQVQDSHAKSQLFSKLFDLFTASDSKGGRNITPEEYTLMMDAWSSYGDAEIIE